MLASATRYLAGNAWRLASFFSSNLMMFFSISTGNGNGDGDSHGNGNGRQCMAACFFLFWNNLMMFSSISTGKTHFEFEGWDWSVGPKVG